VEFALVVPILLLIVFGIINFGVLFSQQLTLNNAVREGARKAVVNEVSTNRQCGGAAGEGILGNVRNQTQGLAVDPNLIAVRITTNGFTSTEPCPAGFQTASSSTNVPCRGSFTSNGTTGSSGSLVVEAEYASPVLIRLPPFPNTITLSSKAVYRCEFNL
jgi:Flp pilus assembly protein TadG